MLIATITLITVALPAITRDLRLGGSGLALVSTAYGLAFGGLLMFGGRLADRFGRRTVFVTGIAVFGAASALAGLAPGVGALVAARFAAGCGAALAAPSAMTLLMLVHPDPAQRRRALAGWGVLASIGAAGGTVLSGLIVTWTSWRWSFLIPTVVAVVAVVAAPRLLPAGPPTRRGRLDLPGATLVTAGLSVLSVGFVRSTDSGLADPVVLAELAAGALCLAGFVLAERHSGDPLVPLRMLASARRAVSCSAVLLAAAATASCSFFLSLFLQPAGAGTGRRTRSVPGPGTSRPPGTQPRGRAPGRARARTATLHGRAWSEAG